jgi:hypothetical protein
MVMLLNVNITGMHVTETVMRSLEGGGWKSANNGNSLATYPTARTVRGGEVREIILPIDSTRVVSVRNSRSFTECQDAHSITN